MLSEPIFHRDSKGKIRSWQYEVDGARWRTISGLIDGEKVTTGWTLCLAKSQETDEEQALFEAKAEEKKKLDRKYARTIDDIDEVRAAGIRPMLAHKYEGWRGPCYAQPKLDGIRCLANINGLWTRTGKKIVSCPHIVEALEPIFNRDPRLVFDGEIYNHDLHDNFNEITSVVKKMKPTEDDFAKAESVIQYHIYDVPRERGFGYRYEVLEEILKGPLGHPALQLVVAEEISTEEELDLHYSLQLAAGYEGQMIRFNGFYEHKRSKQLLKRKEFLDSEFPVVRIEEGKGNWAGVAKRAVLLLPDGREFGAGIKGSQEFCRGLLGSRPETATIRYFALTPDSIPRFPVAVAFHIGERL